MDKIVLFNTNLPKVYDFIKKSMNSNSTFFKNFNVAFYNVGFARPATFVGF